jgi:hypothetical protein
VKALEFQLVDLWSFQADHLTASVVAALCCFVAAILRKVLAVVLSCQVGQAYLMAVVPCSFERRHRHLNLGL